MFGLSSKPKGIPVLPPPIGLDDTHTFTEPISAPFCGIGYQQPYAARIGREFGGSQGNSPHDPPAYRPPSGANPQQWWADTNSGKLEMGTEEVYTTANWREDTSGSPIADNPWLHTAPSPRITSTASPSNYRFVRPFDQSLARENNGTHYSMASQHRSYPLGGMEPSNSLRNTFRIVPPNRDAMNVDLISQYEPAADPAIYISPSPTVQPTVWR